MPKEIHQENTRNGNKPKLVLIQSTLHAANSVQCLLSRVHIQNSSVKKRGWNQITQTFPFFTFTGID